MQQYAVPGFSVAIGRSGRLLYQEAFGWADREAGEAARQRICSASAASASRSPRLRSSRSSSRASQAGGQGIRADGVLGMGYRKPPYEDHLPEITIDHLLAHTSRAWPNDSWTLCSTACTYASCLPGLTSARMSSLRYPPTSVTACSDGDREICGRPYAEFVRENVLSRCGISDMMIGENTPDERRSARSSTTARMASIRYSAEREALDSAWLACGPRTPIVRFAMHVGGSSRGLLKT